MPQLDSIGLRYDDVIVSTDPVRGKETHQSLHQWKADLVNRIGPDLFFEDMPEVVAQIEPRIVVLMPCDEIIRGWIANQVQPKE